LSTWPASGVGGAAVVPGDERFRAPNGLGEWRELTKKVQWDSLHAYGDLLTRVVPDGWPRRLADLNVRYYEELLKGTQALTDQWFDVVERVAPTQRANGSDEADDSAEPHRIPVSLHGAAGDTARASLSLRNRDSVESEISFLVSDFTNGDTEPIRPAVAVHPERFRLGPGEERVVVVEVVLEPALFPVGTIFRGTVSVRGYDNLELALAVWADE
jgi:hypothetical protein